MNIKRTILGLGAILFGVGFFCAAPALAYVGTPQKQGTITCYQEPSIVNDLDHWAGPHYWYCGKNEGMYGTQVKGYLGSITTDKTAANSGKKFLMNNSVKFFVFENRAAFFDFCQGAVVTPVGAPRLIPLNECFTTAQIGTDTRGASLVGGAFPYSVVFETTIDPFAGVTVDEYTAQFIQFNILHEAGHHEDKYLRTLLPSNPANWVNMSTEFASALSKDWISINAFDTANPAGYKNGCHNTTGSKMFVNWRDDHGSWICANNGAGPGVNTAAGFSNSWNNKQVLEFAWPYIYKAKPGNGLGDNAELAASIFSASSGTYVSGPRIPKVGPPAALGSTQEQGMWLNRFTCVKMLLHNLQRSGTVLQCP